MNYLGVCFLVVGPHFALRNKQYRTYAEDTSVSNLATNGFILVLLILGPYFSAKTLIETDQQVFSFLSSYFLPMIIGLYMAFRYAFDHATATSSSLM